MLFGQESVSKLNKQIFKQEYSPASIADLSKDNGQGGSQVWVFLEVSLDDSMRPPSPSPCHPFPLVWWELL